MVLRSLSPGCLGGVHSTWAVPWSVHSPNPRPEAASPLRRLIPLSSFASPGGGGGRNAEVDFRGQRSRSDTHLNVVVCGTPASPTCLSQPNRSRFAAKPSVRACSAISSRRPLRYCEAWPVLAFGEPPAPTVSTVSDFVRLTVQRKCPPGWSLLVDDAAPWRPGGPPARTYLLMVLREMPSSRAVARIESPLQEGLLNRLPARRLPRGRRAQDGGRSGVDDRAVGRSRVRLRAGWTATGAEAWE